MSRPPKMPGTLKRNMTREEQAVDQANVKVLGSFNKLDFSKVPKELKPKEKAEWRRLGKEFGELPLSELDRNAIFNYCVWIEIFKEAKNSRDTLGVMVMQNEVLRENPAIGIMTKAEKEIRAIGSQIGLDLTSRIRLATAGNKADDPEDEFDF